MNAHTPGPWYAWHGYADNGAGFTRIGTKDGEEVLGEYGLSEANAHRIVACVNACEGISTEALQSERYVDTASYQMRKTAEQQCEKLLAERQALLGAVELYKKAGFGNSTCFELQANAFNESQKAIALCEGKPQGTTHD